MKYLSLAHMFSFVFNTSHIEWWYRVVVQHLLANPSTPWIVKLLFFVDSKAKHRHSKLNIFFVGSVLNVKVSWYTMEENDTV